MLVCLMTFSEIMADEANAACSNCIADSNVILDKVENHMTSNIQLNTDLETAKKRENLNFKGCLSAFSSNYNNNQTHAHCFLFRIFIFAFCC